MVSWVGWVHGGGGGGQMLAGGSLEQKGQQQVGYYRCYALRIDHGQIRISIALILWAELLSSDC